MELCKDLNGVHCLEVPFLSAMHKDLGLLCGFTNIKGRKEERKKRKGTKEGKKEGRLKIAPGSIISSLHFFDFTL